MKNNGLKNRFDKQEKLIWEDWHECMRCEENGWEALHHIIAPTDFDIYVPGKHNESLLNSCPLHNHKCHIGEDGTLGNMIPALLAKTREALDWLGFDKEKKDYQFLDKYSQYYG